jgi:molecular chaperone DnaK (HSP70)
MKIGIDLGTTTTTICRVGASALTPLGPYPSLAAFRNEKWVYGNDAAEEAEIAGEDLWLLSNIKLSMTRGDVRVAGRTLDPIDVLGKYLKAVFKEARIEGVDEAVLGIPVRFSLEQRQAMVHAAKSAGAGAVRLVYEPTAALIGALEGQKLHGGDHVLVIDWGGGTLDISLVAYETKAYREVLVSGDINILGGARIDQRLANVLLAADTALAAEVAGAPSGESKFLAQVERAKLEILMSLENDSWPIEPPWLTHSALLKPQLVNQVLEEFGKQAAERLLNLLSESGVAMSSVSHVLFAGGVSQSQVVRDQIRKVLPQYCEELESGTNPQLLTALGCARLCKEGFRLLTAADVVFRESDGQLCTVLPGGREIEPDVYRAADLAVTGVADQLAKIELGVRPVSTPTNGAATSDGRFKRIGEIAVPTGATKVRPLTLAPDDLIRMYVGLTSEMCLHAYAVSRRAENPVESWFTEVPLAVHLGT